MLSAYLRLLIFSPAILIPACASSSLAFLMIYSAYKVNKQGDNIQPWHTPFPIWNQSVVPCPVLTVASWAKLQQYVNCELPDIQTGFRKGRGTRYQIANIQWIIKKAKEFQKNICFCFIDYAKALDCVDHNKLWKIPSNKWIYLDNSGYSLCRVTYS